MNALDQWAMRHHVSREAIAELATIFAPDILSAGVPGGSEAFLNQDLYLTAPKIGCALWRNNSGAAVDATGRLVRYGLGNVSKKFADVWKSSDWIGITPVHWHGHTFGVFTAVEAKAPGWTKPKNEHERAQANFLTNVESLGGIGMFATSVQDYRNRIGR